MLSIINQKNMNKSSMNARRSQKKLKNYQHYWSCIHRLIKKAERDLLFGKRSKWYKDKGELGRGGEEKNKKEIRSTWLKIKTAS